MSNLIVRIREVSQQLAIARAEYQTALASNIDITDPDLEEMEEHIYDLEDELLDLEDELEDETAAKHANTRVDY
jgi:predicted  nucleic acid-binding Zn-ribbon protein